MGQRDQSLPVELVGSSAMLQFGSFLLLSPLNPLDTASLLLKRMLIGLVTIKLAIKEPDGRFLWMDL